MKKILITGKNSYIGTSFEKWVQQWPDQYDIETLDMRNENWRLKDFSEFDVVFHVAGIAHVDIKKATQETKDLYYRVNRDLTIETAAKAKKDGVKQFIFMSSIIVYGDSAPIGQKRVITKDTIPTPSNFYGDSKLQAELGILPMQSEDFTVVVLRPPMIYGKGSKGNYQMLTKIVNKLPVFPDVDNERSMLYIDNLCEFVRLVVNNEENGIYFPQNSSYIKTSDMVSIIAKVSGKKMWITKVLRPVIKVTGFMPGRIGIMINKAFGNSIYDMSMSIYDKADYRIRDFEESISLSIN